MDKKFDELEEESKYNEIKARTSTAGRDRSLKELPRLNL